MLSNWEARSLQRRGVGIHSALNLSLLAQVNTPRDNDIQSATSIICELRKNA